MEDFLSHAITGADDGNAWEDDDGDDADAVEDQTKVTSYSSTIDFFFISHVVSWS